MEIIIHRINKIAELKAIDPEFGIEIDIRTYDSDLILNHNPFQIGDRLVDYLDEYKHGLLVLNIKENGIEDIVLDILKGYPAIKNYFLLDVEFPYIHAASKNRIKNLSIRYSEFESIETVKNCVGFLDWVWVDTFTQFPLDQYSINILKYFKTCLVCPERWKRPGDISLYQRKLKKLDYQFDAVMTSQEFIPKWLDFKT